MEESNISAAFPFESKYLEVLGSKIHYIDEGQGDPILLLHGNPTSSYLWRNVIPHLISKGRCIAPDLIGMGKSDKPDLDYRFEDHYRYLLEFIDNLKLQKITLVLHDWGSGLGFHFAANHQERIKGVVFMEALIRPVSWSDFPPDFKMGFKLMRTPYVGWFMISVLNFFVKKILPQATIRALTAEEMTVYNRPYSTIESRKPVRQWPCEIPIDGKPARMQKIVHDYSTKLKESTYPKLLLYAVPGGLITNRGVQWCEEHLKNLTTVELGTGLHYLQEDHPHKIGHAIAEWL